MSVSTAERDNRLNWFRGTSYPTVPTNVYVSLHSADPGLTGANELTGNGYARVAVSAVAGSWSAPATNGSVRQITNVDPVVFGPATGSDWLQATHFGVWDAPTLGNFKRGDALTTPKTVQVDDTATFAAADLAITEQ